MTTDLIPPSHELVTQARLSMGLTKSDFGALLGVTGWYMTKIETGVSQFSEQAVSLGCASDDQAVRRFWQAYRTARRHEQDVAIIENCIAKEISVEQSTCGNVSYRA